MKLFTFCVVILSIFFLNEIQSKKYTTKNNQTYYIEDQYMFNWYEAHLACSARDMALLTLESYEKYDDIYQLLKSGEFKDRPPHLWVGAIGIKRKFAWILTGKPIIPSLWCNECPNDSPENENCVQFWGDEYGLNDLNCDTRIGFVCEDRIEPEECEERIEKKSNIFLNILQRN